MTGSVGSSIHCSQTAYHPSKELQLMEKEIEGDQNKRRIDIIDSLWGSLGVAWMENQN